VRIYCGGHCLGESHAAAVKHAVITVEKTIGRIKRYLQLRAVIAAKQTANAHLIPGMSAKAAGGRVPSCHANIAANRLEHANRESGRHEKVPIRAIEALYVKVN
jgi:hypothetical protein